MPSLLCHFRFFASEESSASIDCRAGYKHHLTKGYLEYLQAEVMKMCEQHGLHQIDLLSPAKTRISDKEYRAQQRGQKKLDQLNEQITAARMKPAVTVFQTQKQFLRDAILDIISKAATVEDFKNLLKEKYGIEVKERRGRFSYLHPITIRHLIVKNIIRLMTIMQIRSQSSMSARICVLLLTCRQTSRHSRVQHMRGK